MSATPLNTCLACGNTNLEQVLDLNDQPLANSFHRDNEQLESYPLRVNHCSECNHLQLSHIVDPELIYKNYVYVSGTSQTYLDYMQWYAEYVGGHIGGFEGSVLDIGCNDGSQLDAFKALGWKTYGIDPAENLYPISSAKHEVVCGYWNSDLAKTYPHKVDIITSQNAFAHIPDPLQYLKDAATILKDDGKIFISTSQANMVVNGEFDTIYHEHISFYNANSMSKLARRAGLFLVDVKKTEIHGTSYIFTLSKNNENQQWVDDYIEQESHLINNESIALWAAGVQHFASHLKGTVDFYRYNGHRIVGYGAAAKGNTLLNFTGIDMDFIIDDNPMKMGMLTPGSDIRVFGPASLDLMDSKPILFVPLAWNFFKEIKAKIKARRKNSGDVFLQYFPEIEITK